MHEAGMGAAYAEEIFDPMISPRSNAIVAALDAPGNGHGEGALCAGESVRAATHGSGAVGLFNESR